MAQTSIWPGWWEPEFELYAEGACAHGCHARGGVEKAHGRALFYALHAECVAHQALEADQGGDPAGPAKLYQPFEANVVIDARGRRRGHDAEATDSAPSATALRKLPVEQRGGGERRDAPDDSCCGRRRLVRCAIAEQAEAIDRLGRELLLLLRLLRVQSCSHGHGTFGTGHAGASLCPASMEHIGRSG